MYVVLEYVASIVLLAILGAIAFAGAVAVLITEENARRAFHASRRAARRALRLAALLLARGHAITTTQEG